MVEKKYSKDSWNAAERSLDSDSLVEFAVNHTKEHFFEFASYFAEDGPSALFAPIVGFLGVLATPGVFVYHLVASPIVHNTERVKNKSLEYKLVK